MPFRDCDVLCFRISSTAVPCTGFSCYECVYSTMEDSFQQGVNCSDPFDAGKAVGYLKPCSSGICSVSQTNVVFKQIDTFSNKSYDRGGGVLSY